MDVLPEELLEIILSSLPVRDLYLSAALVCTKWRNIIQKESYLKWKRAYHLALAKKSNNEPFDHLREAAFALVEVASIPLPLFHSIKAVYGDNGAVLHPPGHRPADVAAFHFAGWILEAVAKSRSRSPRAFEAVSKHSRFHMASAILKDRFPKFSDNPACCVACLCLLAGDMSEVREILDVHIKVGQNWEVSDLLYEIAAMFLVFELDYGLPKRLRYMLHHALYLHENSWTLDLDVDGFGDDLQFTAEQKRVINYPVGKSREGVVRVLAYAGSGKTTVLRHLTIKNPCTKFLLVVFNKKVQQHAQATFPLLNVTVKTAHSIAYGWCVDNGFNRSRIKHGSLSVVDVLYSDVLPERRGKGSGNIFRRAAMTLVTLRKFCQSARPKIVFDDTPAVWVTSADGTSEHVNPLHRQFVYDDARILWQEAITKRGSSFGIEPTFYLKMFQLSRPDLRSFFDFDVLLMDEGQDMNPAMLDVCLKQSGLKLIVGDPYQQIYGFNGAVNALKTQLENNEDFELVDTLRLTQSFRFGTEVAFVASLVKNLLLTDASEEPRSNFVLGSDNRPDSLAWEDEPMQLQEEPAAILSRTNARLFDEMVTLVCKKPKDERPKIAVIMGDLNYFLVCLAQLSFLKSGMIAEIPKNSKYYRHAKTGFQAYKDHALDCNECEEVVKCRIVEKYGSDIPAYCDIIVETSVPWSPSSRHVPDLIFSTVHQFKGMEFPTVRILDDFWFPKGTPSFRMREEEREEGNILYVALTRAKRKLVLNDTLVFFLAGRGKFNFDRVLPPSIIDNLVGRKCAGDECDRTLQDCVDGATAAVVHNTLSGGYYCATCASAPQMRAPVGYTKKKELRYYPTYLSPNHWAQLRLTLIGVHVSEDNRAELEEGYLERPFQLRPRRELEMSFTRRKMEDHRKSMSSQEASAAVAVGLLLP